MSWVLFVPFTQLLIYSFSLETCVALKIPPRIAFFQWTSALGRFWLLIFYGIRELQLWIGAIWVKGVENQWIIFYFIVPLLLSHGLWYGLYLVFYGLCHKVLLTYFQLCKVLFGKHQKMDLWRAVPHCDLWREQSTRCFEGIEWSILELKYFFLHSLLDWSCVFYSFPCSNFLDMLDHCNLRDWCTWVFWLINFRYLSTKEKKKKKNCFKLFMVWASINCRL